MVSRRTALRVLASGGILGVTGCASIAQEIGDRRRASPNDSYPPPTTQAGKGTTTVTSVEDGESTTTAHAYRASRPTGSLPDAPIPSTPGDFRYATMGDSTDEVVTLYGNWKSPETRTFVVQDLPALARSYVETGRVAIRFRALAYRHGQPYLGPDAPRAAWAGLAVWAHDPDSFWPYFATVFQNHPPKRDAWATLDTLELFLRTAGVENRDRILEAIYGAERDDLVRQTTEAADERDIRSIPRLAYDGEVVAPNTDPDAARDLLERAATGGETTTSTTTSDTGDGNNGIGNGGDGDAGDGNESDEDETDGDAGEGNESDEDEAEDEDQD